MSTFTDYIGAGGYDLGNYSSAGLGDFSGFDFTTPSNFDFDYGIDDLFGFGGTPTLGYDINTLGDLSQYTFGDSSIWDGLGSAWNWLTSGSGKDAIGLGVGLYGMYDKYQRSQLEKDLLKARIAESEGDLSLRNRQAKAEAASELAGKSMISNILANKGHLGAAQSNPWLNYVYQAQNEGQLTPSGPSPFPGVPIGEAVAPMSNADLLAGLQAQLASAPTPAFAGGGLGMLGMMSPNLVTGHGGGQDDKVDALLSPFEYVMDADTVSALGDGNPVEGANRLDKMREEIRAHKRGAPNSSIPAKARSPLEYLGSK